MSSSASSSSSAPAKKGYRFGDLLLKPALNYATNSSDEDPYYFGKLRKTVVAKVKAKDYYFGKITVDNFNYLRSKPEPHKTDTNVGSLPTDQPYVLPKCPLNLETDNEENAEFANLVNTVFQFGSLLDEIERTNIKK